MTRDKYETLEYDGRLYDEMRNIESKNEKLQKELKEKTKEVESLNNIINKLEEFLNEVMESYGYETDITDRIEKITIKNILRKLKELKEKK